MRSSCSCVLIPLILSCNLLLAQSPGARLSGVRAVTVSVGVQYNAAGGVIPVDSSHVRTIVELRLRTVGIRVLTAQEGRASPQAVPYVSLLVLIVPVQDGYAASSHLTVRVSWPAAPYGEGVAPLELWNVSHLQVTGATDPGGDIERGVGKVLDELVNSWLAANPR